MSRPAVATGLGSEAIRDVDGAATASGNVTFARRIIRTLRGNYALYGLAITAMVIYTGTSLVPPLLLRQVVLGLETGGRPALAVSTALLLLALLFLARGVFRFLFIYLPYLVAYRLLCTIRVELFGHLQTRSHRFLTRQQTGQLMSRAVNDVEAIELFVARAFPQIVISLAVPVVIAALMAAISWEVTLVALAFLPFSLAALFFFGPRVKARFKPLRATLAALNAGMQDAMGGVFVTKSFHREAAQLAKLRDQAAAYRDAIFRLLPVGALPLSVAETIANLALVAVAGYGATLVAAGQLRVARHVLPNILGPIIVLATLDVGSVILAVVGPTFLGLGSPPPAPEWGAMLNEGFQYLGVAPHLILFPGLAIGLTVLGFNLVGDGLRDALDPR